MKTSKKALIFGVLLTVSLASVGIARAVTEKQSTFTYTSKELRFSLELSQAFKNYTVVNGVSEFNEKTAYICLPTKDPLYFTNAPDYTVPENSPMMHEPKGYACAIAITKLDRTDSVNWKEVDKETTFDRMIAADQNSIFLMDFFSDPPKDVMDLGPDMGLAYNSFRIVK